MYGNVEHIVLKNRDTVMTVQNIFTVIGMRNRPTIYENRLF